MPLQATSGGATYDAYGGGVPAEGPLYVEDVFSPYVYTGNGSTQTINNGIDLAGKGGLVWIKKRTGSSVMSNYLTDTARGISDGYISSNTTNASNPTQICNAFNNNGFGYNPVVSDTGDLVCSWTFREQPKFFDVVTYTGNGSSLTINHKLGSQPGMIIIKRTDTASILGWITYHQSIPSPFDNFLTLNTTGATQSAPSWIFPTATNFTVGAYSDVNANGGTFVAYIYAHQAGGFGANGTDSIIACGTFTATNVNQEINLGWEPQFLLVKQTNGNNGFYDEWSLIDNIRGMAVNSSRNLYANKSAAEVDWSIYDSGILTPRGFIINANANPTIENGKTAIYMAIRRPMKVPTTGTSVFKPVTYTGNGATGQVLTTGFTVDAEIVNARAGGQGWQPAFVDRLRGNGKYLTSAGTAAQGDYSTGLPTEFISNTAVNRTSNFFNYDGGGSEPAYTYVTWAMARRPAFFEEICYIGTGSGGFFNHNLTVIPELVIIKRRDGTGNWVVSCRALQIVNSSATQLNFNTTAAGATGPGADLPTATNTQFWLNSDAPDINAGGSQYLMYLFATLANVSKVGVYNGNGGTLNIDCGFTAGARFVMIKRSDSTGTWWVWDTARGMVSGTDPRITMNTSSAEINNNWVLTTSNGFQLVTSDATVNASGGLYIYLAIA